MQYIAGGSLPFMLKDGTFRFSDGSSLVISEGTVSFVSGGAATNSGYLNISDLDQNTADRLSAENKNNKPAIFKIPDGAECVLSTGEYLLSTALTYASTRIQLVSAGGSDVIAETPSSKTGPRSVSWVQNGDAPIGCIAIVTGVMNWNDKLTNMTISLTVNGEKWV